MKYPLFPSIFKALIRPKYEIIYSLGTNKFRILGYIKEIVFYDSQEPHTDTRIIMTTDLDDFDVEMANIISFKEMLHE